MSASDHFRKLVTDAYKASGKGVLAFETDLGLKASSIKAIVNPALSQNPSIDKAEKIAKALGLEFYIGPPRHDTTHPDDAARDYSDNPVIQAAGQSLPPDPPPTEGIEARLDMIERQLTEALDLRSKAAAYAPIPLYDVRAAAGDGAAVEWEEVENTLSFRRDWLLSNNLTAANCAIIRVTGDSMDPTLRNGDTILLDRSTAELRIGNIYAFHNDGDLIVKRVASPPGEPVILSSDNPEYSVVALGNDARIIGRVAWSARTYRSEPSGFRIVR